MSKQKPIKKFVYNEQESILVLKQVQLLFGVVSKENPEITIDEFLSDFDTIVEAVHSKLPSISYAKVAKIIHDKFASEEIEAGDAVELSSPEVSIPLSGLEPIDIGSFRGDYYGDQYSSEREHKENKSRVSSDSGVAKVLTTPVFGEVDEYSLAISRSQHEYELAQREAQGEAELFELAVAMSISSDKPSHESSLSGEGGDVS